MYVSIFFPSPILQQRRSVLLDLYTSADSHDGNSLAAYRKGKFKLIQGSYKDAHWYSEPTEDRVNTSDDGLYARVLGNVLTFGSVSVFRF